jgi:transcriptional regulator with XRE-family HTH domain
VSENAHLSYRERLEEGMKSGQTRKPNEQLRQQRILRGWSLVRVADELRALCEQDHREVAVNSTMVWKWEQGRHTPSSLYRDAFCRLYKLTADKLGFIDASMLTPSAEAQVQPVNTLSLPSKKHNETTVTQALAISQRAVLREVSDVMLEIADFTQSTTQTPGSTFIQLEPTTLSPGLFDLGIQLLVMGMQDYGGPQDQLRQHFEDAIRRNEDMAASTLANKRISRRSAITLLSSLPVALLGISVDSNRQSFFGAELASLCAMGIAACWEIYFTGDLEHVSRILPTYRAYLSSLAQQPSPQQKYASSLASQAYQLACELATDQEDFGAAQGAAKWALFYAQQAEDVQAQVASLIRHANLYFHRKHFIYASKIYQQTLPLLKDATPLLRGRVYAGLAEVCAMCNQQQQALSYTGLAHEHYPLQPEQDPAYPYTRFGRYDLYVFADGQTQLSLNQPKKAWESLVYVEKNILGPQSEPLAYVDLAYYQAATSVMLGDLEASISHIQNAVTLAKTFNSRLYYNKILNTYHDMHGKWGKERQFSKLEELFQPW